MRENFVEGLLDKQGIYRKFLIGNRYHVTLRIKEIFSQKTHKRNIYKNFCRKVLPATSGIDPK